jgi:AraC-like DNA-binding protein
MEARRPMLPDFALTRMKAVTEMRAAIDGLAARYAARRVAEGADPEPLLEALARVRDAAQAGDCERVIADDRALHLAIVAFAGVDGMRRVWETAASHMEPFHAETVRECWPDLRVLFEAHMPIVDAICDGDGQAAEDAAKAHLDAVWYRLAEQSGDASLPDDPLNRALAYLAFHLDETIRLNSLARRVARSSPGHLARLFRRQYGCSVTAYLRAMRMHKAVELLARTRIRIRRIAACVGYQDASRFAQHFRARFGLTPRAYRARFAAGLGPLDL